MSKKNEWTVDNSAKDSREDDVAVTPSSSSASDNNVQYLPSPVKPKVNENEYRVILLSNGLKVTLIASPKDNAHEDTCELSSDQSPEYHQALDDFYKEEESFSSAMCCLCVNVGTMSNPPEVPGVSSVLCSYFEHPLFTSKHQKKNDDDTLEHLFIDVLESWEETRYIFSMCPDKLHKALKAFTQPFISLVPTPDQVAKERDRLRNEPSKTLSKIGDEYDTFIKLTTSKHPIRKADTRLGHISYDKLYQEVSKFCKRHYSANRMTVVLQAALPLDTLETYAIECFSTIPNNGLPPENFESHDGFKSFDSMKFRRIWTVNPAKRDFFSHRMDVHWIMPPSSQLYKTKSHEYLACILSDFGAGTLRDYLIKKEWAENVVAEIRKENPWSTSLFSTFTISINLSIEGNEHIIEILDALYSYINFLKREGPQKSIYEGIGMTEDAIFRYLYALNFDEFLNLSKNMHLYESTDYITGSILYYEYDPVSIRNCLELMVPEKGCIFINNKEFGVTFGSNEPFETAPDGSIKIPERLIERWAKIQPFSEFRLPGINRYAPDDLGIIDTPKNFSKYPVIAHSDIMSEVWYKFDPAIPAPVCRMKLCYLSPLPSESVENAVMLDIFASVLIHLLHDELKIAEQAGLFVSMKPTPLGLMFGIDGFTQKLPLLMQTIAKYVRKTLNRVTEEFFEETRFAKYGCYSSLCCDPCLLARNIQKSVLKPGCWNPMDKHNALRSITFSRFRHFLKRFTDHIFIKCLVQGYVSESYAVETARKVVETSKGRAFTPNTMLQHRIKEIPRGIHCHKIKIGQSTDSDKWQLTNYYQLDSSTIKQAVLIYALAILIDNPQFFEFRELAIGWTDMHCLLPNVCDVVSYSFEISGEDNPGTNIDVMEHMDQVFLEKCSRTFTDIWPQLKKKLILSKIEAIKRFPDEFKDHWNEIIHGECIFDRRLRELDAAIKLEAEDFRDFLTQRASNDPNIRKLSIEVIGCISETDSKNALNFIEHDNESGNPNELRKYLEIITRSVN